MTTNKTRAFFDKRMKRKMSIVVLLGAATTVVMAAGPRKTDPDWPCQQVKVGELSLGSFWNGPPLDLSAAWQTDSEISDLVAAVSQRRLPLDQAVRRITNFAHSAKAEKNQALLLVMTGLYNTLGHERAEVLDGLDRFGQRQKVLADGLRQDGEAVRSAQVDTNRDETKISEQTQRLLWDQQVFEARRQSLSFACDVPTAIEQRLFTLAKTIQELLE